MFWWSYYLSSVSSLFLFSFCLIIMFFMIKILLMGNMYIIEWSLLDVFSIDVSMSFLLDWVGMSFSCLVLFISSCVLWFSSSYMEGDIFLRRFIWLVLLFVASMNLLVYIPNLIAILLGWDGLGLVSFLLVIYYQNYKSLSAGMLTVLMNRIGDVMLLLSIGWFLSQGHWNILCCFSSSYSFTLAMCIMVGAMTKSAQIPFSSWLPAAMAAPTPVSALVHSSTLVTAGVFLLIRFFEFLNTFYMFNYILLFISMITMLMAGLSANMESDLKKIIALSTLSQLGVMMFSLSMSLPLLTLFHLYTHALFKALLFLCAGSVIHACQHVQDLRFLGMLTNQMPMAVSCLNVANLALCGFPFLAGFYSKDVILEMFEFMPYNLVMFILLFLATGLTASYSARLSVMSLWGSFNFFSFQNLSDEDSRLVFPMFFLVFGAVLAGSGFSWVLFDSFSVLILPLYLKVMALLVTFLGGWLGWKFSDSVYNYSKSSFFLMGSFTVTMWYLTYLTTQLVILFPLKLSYGFLYILDRGWNEVLGGKGASYMVNKMSTFVVSWQSAVYMIYVTLMGITFISLLLIFSIFF